MARDEFGGVAGAQKLASGLYKCSAIWHRAEAPRRLYSTFEIAFWKDRPRGLVDEEAQPPVPHGAHLAFVAH